jgi:hypothetical protein
MFWPYVSNLCIILFVDLKNILCRLFTNFYIHPTPLENPGTSEAKKASDLTFETLLGNSSVGATFKQQLIADTVTSNFSTALMQNCFQPGW